MQSSCACRGQSCCVSLRVARDGCGWPPQDWPLLILLLGLLSIIAGLLIAGLLILLLHAGLLIAGLLILLLHAGLL